MEKIKSNQSFRDIEPLLQKKGGFFDFYTSDFKINLQKSLAMFRCYTRLFPYFFVLLVLISINTRAQTSLRNLDTSRIKQKSIRNFLKSQIEKGIVNFEDFLPSVTAQTDSSNFDFNVHHFKLQQNREVAWEAYLIAHPAQIWQGKVISYGFIFSPVSKNFIFNDNNYPGLEIGQVFFIEMRVLCKLVRFPVCFIITKIDKDQKLVSFSYVASGQSKGSQTIKLCDDGKGGTEINHSSIHQTENGLRDKTLYPIYHRKAIREVHRNIRNLLNAQSFQDK